MTHEDLIQHLRTENDRLKGEIKRLTLESLKFKIHIDVLTMHPGEFAARRISRTYAKGFSTLNATFNLN